MSSVYTSIFNVSRQYPNSEFKPSFPLFSFVSFRIDFCILFLFCSCSKSSFRLFPFLPIPPPPQCYVPCEKPSHSLKLNSLFNSYRTLTTACFDWLFFLFVITVLNDWEIQYAWLSFFLLLTRLSCLWLNVTCPDISVFVHLSMSSPESQKKTHFWYHQEIMGKVVRTLQFITHSQTQTVLESRNVHIYFFFFLSTIQ